MSSLSLGSVMSSRAVTRLVSARRG
jgi:hypothetical protein